MPTSFDLTTSSPEAENEFKFKWNISYSCKKFEPYKNWLVLQQVEVTALNQILSGYLVDVTILIDFQTYRKVSFHGTFSSCPPKLTSQNFEKFMDHHGMIIKIEIFQPDNSIGRMIDNYHKLLNNDKTNDVKFIIGENKIAANTQLLSGQSTVFESMFKSEMLEKKSGQVKINDIEPEIFKCLLNFINYGKVIPNNCVDHWLKLLVAADKYSVASLVSICEDHISKILKTDSVTDVLITADLVNAKSLKKKSIKFILKNKCGVVKTDGYKNLVESRPDLLSELFCSGTTG